MRERTTLLRHTVSMITAFALVVSSLVSLRPSVANAAGEVLTVAQAAAPTVITVAQAIATNTGTATVEGYIVGVTNSGPTYQFSAPFTATNIAIADSPQETQKAKILPVQLPSGAIRDALNLSSHPENLGIKLQITGTLKAYFGVPGLQSPTSFTLDGTNPPPPPPDSGNVISIAAAKAMANQTVKVEGIVTADNSAIGGGKLSTYIQDQTTGVNIFSTSPGSFPDLKEGDKVQVTGKVTSYHSLTEVAPTNIQVISSGNPLPVAKQITLQDLTETSIAEPLEGQLVKVRGYVSAVPATPAGGGYNVTIIDETFNTTTLRVMTETGIVQNLQVKKWYDFTAVLSQYDEYQLIPRKVSDAALLEQQLPAPKPAPAYSSTVKSVVDGDTIHLSTPVLGTDKVRFLNIDTPETYHNVVTEADANQKRLGEAAKSYMNTLLKAGDEVEVRVGQEPKDNYGRLLAQIIRKSDGLNINLEMVRKGYASTYFIWPIDEQMYPQYSLAVKEAKDKGLGIWNPQDPLMELPFVFRAREQGKGLLRYVGDYFNKTYVSPEEWAKVPVEARVFLSSPEEAQEAGYVSATGGTQEPLKVQLLSINDLHGKIDQTYDVDINNDRVNDIKAGRMDYLASYIKEREASNPNTLLVHAGDAVGGSSPVSALLQDEPTVDIMEAMGFDVGTIGNHELDEGVDEMLRLIQGGTHPHGTPNYDGMNFPLVAANLVYKSNGQPVLPPYVVKEVNGTKIGFIGVVTRSAAGMVMPAGIQNVEFTNETAAVNKATDELKAQGVHAIVVLAHMDADQSGTTVTGPAADLANNVNDEVDVIFAAHNHKVVNGTVDNKLIVQAFEYGKAFADVDLELDPTTDDIVKKSAEIVYVDQALKQPDPVVSGILTKYENQIADQVNAVVGQADGDITGGYAAKGVLGDNGLGNLIADGMRASMNSDFAMMNGGGIRQNLNSGPITWGELFNIQPFNNVLMKLDIKGADMEPILNAQLSKTFGPDYSISGFRYTWDSTTAKVVGIFLPDGSPIDKTKTYTLTVNNFMATSTGSKYKPIGQLGKNPVTGPEDLEATVDFVKNYKGDLAYQPEGRISEDFLAPVTTLSKNGQQLPDSSFLNTVTISLAAIDNDSVRKMEYSLDNGTTWTTYTEPFVIAQNGETEIQYRSIDRVGNIEPVQQDKVLVTVDKTPPVSSVKVDGTQFSDGSYLGQATVTLSAVDDRTGVAKIEYSMDNGSTWNVYSTPVVFAEDGAHTITVRATDKAGNVEAVRTHTVQVKAATVANLKALVESHSIEPKGIKQSILSHIENADHEFAKASAANIDGDTEQAAHFADKGYESLQKIKDDVSKHDKFIGEVARTEIVTMIDYMTANKTVK